MPALEVPFAELPDVLFANALQGVRFNTSDNARNIVNMRFILITQFILFGFATLDAILNTPIPSLIRINCLLVNH